MFDSTIKAENCDKEKWVCGIYGIALEGPGSWNLANDYAMNAVAFGVDNCSSSHTDNRNNKFIVLVKNQLMVLMEVLVHQRQNLVLILVKQRQNFAWVYDSIMITVTS